MAAAAMNPNGKFSRSWRPAPSASGRSRSQSEHPGSSLIHQTIGRMFGQTQSIATQIAQAVRTKPSKIQFGLKPNEQQQFFSLQMASRFFMLAPSKSSHGPSTGDFPNPKIPLHNDE
ncbi:hypothetical protein ACLOJK_022696 [Asimina triloba]